MTLEDLGYNKVLEKFRTENQLEDYDIGKVIAEHKERYIVKTITGEYESEITGALRFGAKSREDFLLWAIGLL
jgi:ribosome biogenesis GTPase / thiamine phosphate phosphatase